MILGMISLSLLPDIIKWKNAPPGRLYNPVHNNAIDYALYLSYEKQGLDGQSVLYDRFTTEPHPGKWVNPFYLILGRIWNITGVQNPHIVYHAARIILGTCWVLLLWWYIRRSLETKIGRLLALFFVLFGAGFPRYTFPNSLLTVFSYVSWWSELDPVIRATFLPAHLAGHILMLTTIICFTRKKLAVRHIALGTISGFFAGLFHTPSLMLPILLLPTWALVTGQWKRFGTICLVLLVCALSFVILAQQFRVLPWTNYWEYERMSFALPLREYVLGVGPVFFLAAIGAVLSWKNPKLLIWILWGTIGISAVWLIPIITSLPFPIARTLLVSNIRFIQIGLIVPLSILASMSLVWLRNTYGTIVFSGFMLILFVLTFLGYPASLYRNATTMFNDVSYQYPTVGWTNAINSLERGNKEKAVLSLPFAGQAIGGYVNRTAYIARPYSTLNLYKKTDLAWSIYNTTMPVCEAYQLLMQNRIGDVFFGYDEKTAGGDLTRYPFLKLKQDFGDTQIFTFTGVKPSNCLE